MYRHTNVNRESVNHTCVTRLVPYEGEKSPSSPEPCQQYILT